MAEYIEREAAQEVLKRFCEGMRQDIPRYPNAIRLASKDIDEIPAADVVEVKHGRWEIETDHDEFWGDMDYYKCSLCGNLELRDTQTPYCPNCGARMDGE
jgi:rubrerythrin